MIFKFFSSIKLTVVCLLWLLVLTFWGTVYQVDHGIFRAQENFFYSFFLITSQAYDSLPLLLRLIAWIPLPGGMLVMGLLFFNLLTSFFVHYQAGWRMPGLMLTHIGLIMLFLGGFFTRISGVEARVRLLEGHGTNTAFSVSEWEVYQVTELTRYREVDAAYFHDMGKRDRIRFSESGLTLTVMEHHVNATGIPARASAEPLPPGQISPSGLAALQPIAKADDPTRNLPGLRLQVEGASAAQELILWGGDDLPARLIQDDGKVVYIGLRRRRYELPLFMELVDFEHKYYPGSRVPKDFRSRVVVHLDEDRNRSVDISMNHPFRLNGWTFFQHSFSDQSETEMSEFAVTRNFGRLIPYWATGITSLGLALHFLQIQWMQAKRQGRTSA